MMKTMALLVVGAILVSGSAFAAQTTDGRKGNHSVTLDGSPAVIVAAGQQRAGRLSGSSLGGKTIFGS
ncbi:hypothetical protein [Ochrobactrum sp. BTU1]|uniref:hypothetical protein n=1 Tax=Ochrobactrum sp. BTU1 TaxID=2840456 RepID=UPI001C03D61F|nr:hypothetical protein KMS41_21715 [Ochrobactrum sp. BTU1]